MAAARHGFGREVGSAIAVLAIYVLTLLLPLHQAAGLQRDLGRLGFETAGAWSVCAPLAKQEREDPLAPAAFKCPAAGVAKHDLAAVLPSVTGFVPPGAAGPRLRPAGADAPLPGPLPHVGQPRAPPVAV